MKILSKTVQVPGAPRRDCLWCETLEHNDRKYRVFVKIGPGTFRGFDFNCCACVMNADMLWVPFVDGPALGVKPDERLWAASGTREKTEAIERAVNAFHEYIEAAS